MKECTKPNCHCAEVAEVKNGSPVKSYPCLAGSIDDELKSGPTDEERLRTIYENTTDERLKEYLSIWFEPYEG